LRRSYRLIDLHRVQAGVESGRQDDGVLVDLPVLQVERERGSIPLQGTAQAEPIELSPVRWPRGLSQQWVARVQNVIVVLRECLPAEGVAAWLGEDLNASETGPVVLR
jgi:hypothetical protein